MPSTAHPCARACAYTSWTTASSVLSAVPTPATCVGVSTVASTSPSSRTSPPEIDVPPTSTPIVATLPVTARSLIATSSPATRVPWPFSARSEEHTSELQSQFHLVCRLLLEKKNKIHNK